MLVLLLLLLVLLLLPVFFVGAIIVNSVVGIVVAVVAASIAAGAVYVLAFNHYFHSSRHPARQNGIDVLYVSCHPSHCTIITAVKQRCTATASQQNLTAVPLQLTLLRRCLCLLCQG